MPTVRRPDLVGPTAWTLPLWRHAARAAKHGFDRAAAAIALIATSPLIAALALALRRRGGPVLRREALVGEEGRVILMLSLAIPDSWQRVTGADALPRLWNVLRGELSLVGPEARPPGLAPPPVRPGLTGLAQLSPDATLADRLVLDAEYARSWSPVLDVRILARTMVRARMPDP